MYTRSSIASAVLRAAGAVSCTTLVMCLAPAPAAAQFVCQSTGGGADGAVATGPRTVVCGTGAGVGAGTTDNSDNSAFGSLAGQFVDGHSNSAFGRIAGHTVTGDLNSAFGTGAGRFVTGDNNSASGGGAGRFVTGSNNSAVGVNAGVQVNGDSNSAVGFTAGLDVNGNSNSAFGNAAGQLVIGSNNVAIGNGAGSGTIVLGDDDIPLVASNTVAIGNTAIARTDGGIAIGNQSQTGGTNSVAVGAGTNAGHENSAAFGNGATTTRANQQVFGTASNTYTMSGIASTASRAVQSGPVQIVTSDSGGNLATASLSDLGLASIGDINAINARLSDLTKESRRGIAATAALAVAMTPSAPGKTTVSLNSGFFKGETGVGVALAHRLNFSTPFILHGSYANAGGNGHVGRVGFGFEF